MVVLAAILFVLNLFGLLAPSVIAAATLAVLTLLGVALLVNRHQADQLRTLVSELGRSQPLANGQRIRVLLIQPGGSALAMAAYRAGHRNTRALSVELEGNLKRLASVQSKVSGSGTLEIRVTDYLPPYSMYAFDPDGEQGIMELAMTFFRHRQTDMRPIFRLHQNTDADWYGYFRSQFAAVWEQATTWEQPVEPEQAS
jgi:hypothetical protein